MTESAPIPEELQAMYKAATAYAIVTRKIDIEGEEISNETFNEIEHEYHSACDDLAQQDHRISDFDPFAVVKLIERIAQLEAAVAELRAINERLVLDVKRSTEENERLQAQIYHD